MKRTISYLLPVLFLLGACGQDPIIETPVLEGDQFFINYDGENEAAPQLPAGGFFEAATQLTPDTWETSDSASLVSVYFYLDALPEESSLLIYRGGANDRPDTLLLSQSLSRRQLTAGSWNKIDLDRAILLEDQDIWISYRFTNAVDQRTLGCDPGPANPLGNWLYDSFDEQWISLETRTQGGIDINWNLRGVVNP